VGYVNGAAATSTGAATSLSYSHSLSAGSNRAVVVFGTWWRNNATSTLNGVTYDGQTCSVEADNGHVADTNFYGVCAASLPDASLSGSGSKTVVVTLNQSTDEIASTVQAYDGIDQTTGPVRSGSQAGTDGSGTAESSGNATVNIPTTVGDLAVAAVNFWDDGASHTTSQTERQAADGAGADQTNCHSIEWTATGSSTTMAYSLGMCIAGFALVPATGGGAATAEQEGYRWRNDDGTEAGASWKAAQDTPITAASGKFRLRVILNATGDLPAGLIGMKYNVNDGSKRTVHVP
jgi:hypothetical protein